jgi:hypothetical protein
MALIYGYAIFPKLILTQVNIFIPHKPIASWLNLEVLEKCRLPQWSKYRIFLNSTIALLNFCWAAIAQPGRFGNAIIERG